MKISIRRGRTIQPVSFESERIDVGIEREIPDESTDKDIGVWMESIEGFLQDYLDEFEKDFR